MKLLGFGCMRLPMKDGAIDQTEVNRMIDLFLAEGFTYFDTAHGYHSGNSELALREGLTQRYPRERYQLTNKLTSDFFRTEEDIRPFFEQQLRDTGVSYFDYYLMHALTEEFYEKFERCNAFAVAQQLKAEGKIRHVGISFHDKPALLERILTEHPEIEAVQIQLNYADWDNPSVESQALYEICRKFDKPVIVMEPVKGGGLADLPADAQAIFDERNGGSAASYAVRFAASLDGVFLVLGGMSSYDQMADNISYMKDFQPLSEDESDAVDQVRAILKQQDTIPCTACRYCVDGCPQHIAIPEVLACLNNKKRYAADWNSDYYYGICVANHGKASDCIACKKCEQSCPQHLPIVDLLQDAAKAFE